jgi:hypothetical protein
LSKRTFIRGSLAAFAIAMAGVATPSTAAVSAFLSAGTTCGRAASSNFVTSGAPVKVSLCVTTTTEPVCGATLQLRSANAGEDGRFFVGNRVLGTALPDPSAASLTFPVGIVNPPWRWTSEEPRTRRPARHRQPTCCSQRSIFLPGERHERHLRREPGRLLRRRTEPTNCLSGNAVDIPITASFTLNRVAPPVITSGSSATFAVNSPNSFAVTATGSPTPTFSISGTAPRASPSARHGHPRRLARARHRRQLHLLDRRLEFRGL